MNGNAELIELTAMYSEQFRTMGRDPATEAIDQAKTYATLQARAALAGFELVRMPGGDFVVGRWGMVRALTGADAVEAFLQQVGAA
ncbi:hypothetical protein X551_04045 [Methylibium sp. T29]|nr:hypothetical protein X551_04045 [Methylibium sp. T29]